MAECSRCGAIAELEADGEHWCGVGCLELSRRGIPCRPEEAPLRLTGKERLEGVDQMLADRRDQELRRLEVEAAARRERGLERAERDRYALPEADRYGTVDLGGRTDG